MKDLLKLLIIMLICNTGESKLVGHNEGHEEVGSPAIAVNTVTQEFEDILLYPRSDNLPKELELISSFIDCYIQARSVCEDYKGRYFDNAIGIPELDRNIDKIVIDKVIHWGNLDYYSLKILNNRTYYVQLIFYCSEQSCSITNTLDLFGPINTSMSAPTVFMTLDNLVSFSKHYKALNDDVLTRIPVRNIFSNDTEIYPLILLLKFKQENLGVYDKAISHLMIRIKECRNKDSCFDTLYWDVFGGPEYGNVIPFAYLGEDSRRTTGLIEHPILFKNLSSIDSCKSLSSVKFLGVTRVFFQCNEGSKPPILFVLPFIDESIDSEFMMVPMDDLLATPSVMEYVYNSSNERGLRNIQYSSVEGGWSLIEFHSRASIPTYKSLGLNEEEYATLFVYIVIGVIALLVLAFLTFIIVLIYRIARKLLFGSKE